MGTLRSYLGRIKHALQFTSNDEKVNLFIVGEQKCGTSSLHEMLVQSNQIVQGSRKEMHFFDSLKFDEQNVRAYNKEFEYRRLGSKPKYRLDSTPSYGWNSKALPRIASYNPNAKLIYLTRDPVKRFFSAFKFYKEKVNPDNTRLQNPRMLEFLSTNRDFGVDEFFEVETSSDPVFHSLERGEYDRVITKMNSLFPQDQILILRMEDLVDPTKFSEMVSKVEQFLGISVPGLVLPQKNVTRSTDVVWPEHMIEYLTKHYKKKELI